MIISDQYTYNKTYKLFFEAKKSGDLVLLKDSIINLTKTINKIIEDRQTNKELALFVSDHEIIFAKKHNKLGVKELAVEINSSGYLDQILEELNVESHSEISNNLYESIFDLYAEISQGNINTEKQKMEVKKNIEILLSTI